MLVALLGTGRPGFPIPGGNRTRQHVFSSKHVLPAFREICPQLKDGVTLNHDLNVVPPIMPAMSIFHHRAVVVAIPAVYGQVHPANVGAGVFETGPANDDFLLMVRHRKVTGFVETGRNSLIRKRPNHLNEILVPVSNTGNKVSVGQYSYIRSALDSGSKGPFQKFVVDVGILG